MKRLLIVLIAIFSLSLQPDKSRSVQHQKAPFAAADDDLKSTISQEKIGAYITRIFGGYHFRKFNINDSLSTKMYDNYLNEIDGGKYYLLASDVEYFEKYRNLLDDGLNSGDLKVAFEMYNVFRKRYKERSAYLNTVLEKPFEFNTDELFNHDREKANWAKNTEELNEVWRKLIKNEALDLKLSGKADTAIISLLKDRYKTRDRNLGRIKSDQVFQMYMNSFCEVLDPHTRYMAPQDADRFKQSMFQQLEGIGALLREDGNYIKIAEVIAGGPAFKSKLVFKDDKIIGVAQGTDGKMEDIVGWYVDDAVKKIKGPKGTTVRLLILPATPLPGGGTKEITLVREKINLQDQRAKQEIVSINHNKKDYKIGVIKLPSFYRDFEGAGKREKDFASTTRDVARLIDSLKQKNIDGLVLDLRNNGGGSLAEAISLTGLFIQKGPVVQVKESTGESETYTDPDPNVAYDGPLAVLTNRFSASASEIFAGAIQDYKRGIIVGEQTYGKGTVQTMVDLNQWMPNEKDKLGQVNITVQKFYRVNGSSTQRKGVTPDIEFPSIWSAEKYGESSEPTALPWDQINTSKFDMTKFVTAKEVDKIKDKYQQRLKSDIELKKFVTELDYLRQERENTVVSLQLAKRQKQKEESEKKREAIKKLGGEDEEDDNADKKTATTKKKAKDIYMIEAGRIVADYVTLHKEPKWATKM